MYAIRSYYASIISAIYKNEKLTQVKEIFRAQPDTKTGPHWGCRITFGVDNTLFFGVGERGTGTNAQTLSNHCGKIHHINEDGSIPKDNPFINTPGAMPSIWSYGHRNPQGLIFDKTTGILWEHEHGPRGGDDRITSYNVCYTKLLRVSTVLLCLATASRYNLLFCTTMRWPMPLRKSFCRHS